MQDIASHFAAAIELVTAVANTGSESREASRTAECVDCCPYCRIRMVRLGTCFSCPICGYGSCE
jgi:hypothetical protein